MTDDRGMQALVAIGFGGGDIILEPVGQRVIHIVDQAQGAVTLSQCIQDDPHRIDIIDLVKGLILHDGLAVDAIDALDPALDGRTSMPLSARRRSMTPDTRARNSSPERTLSIWLISS